ncbi:hypothetical protein [Sphingopyxis sp. MWB1]|uniref:hypothetical protein n=1 Tax=Sphingopyxis sp. MWB1 TaxID=1537715 RepID=UPI00051A373B|nr:hypothetical protein [Sphingopyxis sp. MWB1]
MAPYSAKAAPRHHRRGARGEGATFPLIATVIDDGLGWLRRFAPRNNERADKAYVYVKGLQCARLLATLRQTKGETDAL